MRRLLSSLGRALWVPLALLGCGEVAGDAAERVERPGIDASELRCGPVEVAPIGRAERLVPLPNGEIYLVGNSYNRFRQPSGKVVQFDPTGAQRPLVHELGWPVMALTLTDQGLITAMDKASFFRWPEARFEDPEQVVSVGGIQELTALELVRAGEHDLISGAKTIAAGEEVPAVFRVSPIDGSLVWWTPYVNSQGIAVIDGHFTSITTRPDGQVIAVGKGIDAWNRQDRYGVYVRFDADRGFLQARREHPQKDFEPIRLVKDRQGEPVVLAIEGHEGLRYVNARPFMARFDDDGGLIDKREIALPPGTSQGALLAARQMQDGGWLLGGSACGEQRAWCQAWIVRTDRAGQVVWSRTVARDVAATVNDLHVTGNRVFAAISSSYYCCEFDELDYDGWLWELDLDGNCPLDAGLKADGTVFR